MRKFSIAGVIAILVAFGGAALARGDSAESSKGKSSAKVIKVFGKVAQIKLIDLGDPGFSLGDEAVFSDDLLTEKNGKTVGLDGGVCTVIRVADASTQAGTLQCLVTFSLKQGQIATQSLSTVTNGQFTGTQASAITGGTGRYRKAAGEVTIEFVSNAEVNVTLSIRK